MVSVPPPNWTTTTQRSVLGLSWLVEAEEQAWVQARVQHGCAPLYTQHLQSRGRGIRILMQASAPWNTYLNATYTSPTKGPKVGLHLVLKTFGPHCKLRRDKQTCRKTASEHLVLWLARSTSTKQYSWSYLPRGPCPGVRTVMMCISIYPQWFGNWPQAWSFTFTLYVRKWMWKGSSDCQSFKYVNTTSNEGHKAPHSGLCLKVPPKVEGSLEPRSSIPIWTK